MRVQVDEARRHDQAAGIDHLVGIVGAELADPGDHAVLDADVAAEARQAAAVDDHAATDDAVEPGHASSCFAEAWAWPDSVKQSHGWERGTPVPLFSGRKHERDWSRALPAMRAILAHEISSHPDARDRLRGARPADGAPVILLHGFPYDPRCFDEVAPPLASDGCRVLVPYMRGYGPTRFLSPTRRARASRPRSAMTCCSSWMRSRSGARP